MLALSDTAVRPGSTYRTPPLDAVMLESRAAGFAKRSLKKEAKRAAIDLAIRCIDLTTLEGRDSPGRVRSLCAKAAYPAPGAPPVAAVCVYPNLVRIAKDALTGTGVKVASVATAFPSGLSSLDVKLRDTEAALAAGADEIDMVIDRGAFLAGDEGTVFEEIAAVKRLCGEVHVKAILEAGELGSYDAIRRASDIALEAGADTIKTSTGKIGVSATLPTALAMAEAIRDFQRRTGERRGLKVAGGIRTTKLAIAYLVLLDETLGAAWLDPGLFRIGASALLDDLLLQREKESTGRYGSFDYISKD
ncbi:MAG: deoxyribose-phosphate aldolase [Candidatus Velthaea sp.]